MELTFKRPRRVKPSIDMTPLIDCVFNLLIFFAVTTTFISAQSGVDVTLPKSSVTVKQPNPVVFAIEPDGEIKYGEETVAPEDVVRLTTEKIAENPETNFLIQADEKTLYKNLFEVIDLIRGAGGQKLGLQAEPVEPADEEGAKTPR